MPYHRQGRGRHFHFHAAGRAAIVTHGVAVVTLLALFDDAVAATGSGSPFRSCSWQSSRRYPRLVVIRSPPLQRCRCRNGVGVPFSFMQLAEQPSLPTVLRSSHSSPWRYQLQTGSGLPFSFMQLAEQPSLRHCVVALFTVIDDTIAQTGSGLPFSFVQLAEQPSLSMVLRRHTLHRLLRCHCRRQDRGCRSRSCSWQSNRHYPRCCVITFFTGFNDTVAADRVGLPFSFMQLAEQPSLSMVLRSSHSSPASTMPLPQTGSGLPFSFMQLAEQPSLSMVLRCPTLLQLQRCHCRRQDQGCRSRSAAAGIVDTHCGVAVIILHRLHDAVAADRVGVAILVVQLAEQPSLPTELRSSHSSPASTMPLPQTGSGLSFSFMQLAEQPSLPTALRRHTLHRSTIPLPQTGSGLPFSFMQLAEQPSLSMVLRSSHSSPASTIPLPQTGSGGLPTSRSVPMSPNISSCDASLVSNSASKIELSAMFPSAIASPVRMSGVVSISASLAGSSEASLGSLDHNQQLATG